MELRIDMDKEWFNFIKEKKIQSTYPTFFYFNNKPFHCIYENDTILNSDLKVLACKNRIEVVGKITDVEILQFLCTHDYVDVLIGEHKIRHYPSYTIKKDLNTEQVYIDDLNFIEL